MAAVVYVLSMLTWLIHSMGSMSRVHIMLAFCRGHWTRVVSMDILFCTCCTRMLVMFHFGMVMMLMLIMRGRHLALPKLFYPGGRTINSPIIPASLCPSMEQ